MDAMHLEVPLTDSDGLGYISAIREDPTAPLSWTEAKCQQLVIWMCSENSTSSSTDFTALHCILKSGKVMVNDQLLCSDGQTRETALSLAVRAGNQHLFKYLCKMGASPDVLVGWDQRLHQPASFAMDRLHCHAEFDQLFRMYSRSPNRFSPGEDKISPTATTSRFIELVRDYKMLLYFAEGIEFDVMEARLDWKVVSSWSRLRCAFVMSRLIKRRPGGPIPQDYFMLDLLFNDGKVAVNDILVPVQDSETERTTALYEAVARKNVDFVLYLLERHKADPNVRCFVDGMPWHDMTHIVYPIGIAMRAFLLWGDEETAAVERITDFLMDAGIKDDVLFETISAALQPNVVSLMEVPEALHFLRTVRKIVALNPSVVSRFAPPITHSVVKLLSICEQKHSLANLRRGSSEIEMKKYRSVFHEGVLLVKYSVMTGAPFPDNGQLLDLLVIRSHFTLARLMRSFGNWLPPCGWNSADELVILDAYTDDHAELSLEPEEIRARDCVRISALTTVLARSTTAIGSWIPVLRELHLRVHGDGGSFPADCFSLRNRSIAAVNALIQRGKISDTTVWALPLTVYRDLVMEKEFYDLRTVLI